MTGWNSSPERPSLRFALRTACVLLATCSALWLAGVGTSGASAWPRFEDDAYYYLVIARNVAFGHGVTADGLSPTNGFQPLWMWSLVPLAWLTGGDTAWLLGAAQLAEVLMFCASGALLCALLRAQLGLAPALFGMAVLLFPRFLNVLVCGLESGLAVLVGVLLIAELWRGGALRSPEPSRSDARAGALFGLLFLARLDSVFLAFACAVAVVGVGLLTGPAPLGARIARGVRKGLAVFWPAPLLAAPYLAWNLLAFGHLVPISGALKTSHSELAFMPGNVTPTYLALIAVTLAAAALELRRGGDRVLGRALAALGAGCALQALHSMVFMTWGVFTWHFALFIPIGAVGVAVLARAVAARAARALVRAGLAVVALGLVAAQAYAFSRLTQTFTYAGREAGRWVARSLPADAVLGMKDSGAFSYFAERKVMNMDGVANSFEYQETLCRGGLAEFLARRGVQYVAQHSVPPDVAAGAYESYTQPYPCHFAGGRDGSLTFRREQEVFRGTPYLAYGGSEHQLIIWRIAP
jgi:hypothetical protein